MGDAGKLSVLPAKGGGGGGGVSRLGARVMEIVDALMEMVGQGKCGCDVESEGAGGVLRLGSSW